MRQILFLLFLQLLIAWTRCELNEGHDVKDMKEKLNLSGKNDIHNIFDRKSYQSLLKTMRKHQSSAVQSMFAVKDNKQLKALLNDVVTRMKKVLENSKKVVETARFQPSSDAFPSEDPLRESVAKIIENTAFYLEMTVFMPDFLDFFTHKVPELKSLIKWCYEFTQKMDLYDPETKETILSGAQELLIEPRPKGYKNLYRKIYMKNMKQQEAFDTYKKMVDEKEKNKKSEAKLKPKKSGPKLSSRSEL